MDLRLNRKSTDHLLFEAEADLNRSDRAYPTEFFSLSFFVTTKASWSLKTKNVESIEEKRSSRHWHRLSGGICRYLVFIVSCFSLLLWISLSFLFIISEFNWMTSNIFWTKSFDRSICNYVIVALFSHSYTEFHQNIVGIDKYCEIDTGAFLSTCISFLSQFVLSDSLRSLYVSMPVSTGSSEDSDLRPFKYANIFSRCFYQ